MDVRRPRDGTVTREPFDPRDMEISRLKREVEILRGREKSARFEAQDARKHFADLTSMSKRFAHSMRVTVGERKQQRRRLAAQYAVSKVLAEARDLDEAAPKIYEILGERLGWHAGALWKVGEDPDGCRVLRRVAHWSSGGSLPGALEAADEGTVLRRGEGLPGRVWERCEPVWVEDLLAEENMPRKTATVEDGLRGALAFPIVDGGFFGVFELFRREVLPPDEDLMRTAGLVGGQISQFLERRHAEEERDRALVRERAAHERTAGILESINDAFFTLDGEWRFVYVNNKAEKLLGTTREELLGRKMWEVYPEVLGSESYRATQETLKNGKAAEFETVSPILGIWISVRVYPSADGASVLFHSIEERKRAEEALRESEERYRTLFESIDEGFCTIEVLFDEDGEAFDYRFRETNPAFEKQTGLKEVTGRTVRELVPDHEDWWFETCGRVALTGEPVRFEGRAEGLDRWFDVYAYRVGEPGSRTAGILFKDVTQRKLAAEALHESEAQLSAIFSEAAVGLCEVSTDGSFLMVNDELCKILKRSREDLLATNVPEITHPDNVAETVAGFERLIEAGETFSLDKRCLRPDGTAVCVNSTLTRLDDERGHPRGALAVVVDLTQRKAAEEALRRSEERLQQAVAIETVGVIFFKPDGSVTDSNDAFLRMSGYDREDLAAGLVRWDTMTPPEYMPHSLKAIDEFLALGRTLPYEKEYIRKDGSRWWALFAATRLEGGEGAEFIVDITETKRAEEALRQSEERYRSLAEATSSIVWTADTNGAIVEEIPAWEAFTGQTYSEYRGFGWLGALHPEDRPPENLWEELTAAEPETMKEEYRLRHRSGEYRRVVLRGVPIVGETGETREWVGTVFDVEDHRRAEEEREGLRRAAERERARLEGVLQQMPGGVFVAEPSGRFVLVNEGATRTYGREIGSVEECGVRSLSYPGAEELAPEDWPLSRALRGEAVSGMEYYVVRPDGTRRVVRANSAPVLDGEGNVVAAVKAFEDVTRRKEVERERDRSHEREQQARATAEQAERRLAFYAGAREERQVISRDLHDRVAHSIVVVRQNLELYEVLRDRNPEAAAKKMKLAKEEATASLKSTRDLSMMLRRSEVEDGMVKALAGLEETTIPMGVRYSSTVTGDESLVPPHIGNQVFLVLREAVRNAVNHSDCGHIEVKLEIAEEGVIATVEDDGRGFEPDGAHAGGGLRSMEERASLVGGTFRLRSDPDGGARIEVSVPLQRADAR